MAGGGGVAGFLPLPFIPRTENVIRFAVQYVFDVFHFFLTVTGRRRRRGGGIGRRGRRKRNARWGFL